VSIEVRFRIEQGEFVLDVEATLPGQGVTALFGPSGCGKTTFLRAVAGLERPPGGLLRVGEAVWQDGEWFLPPHRRPVGYVFQEASLFSHLDVLGNLRFGLRRVPREERRVSLERVIELFGLGPLLGRRADQLSGGERQRVAIARALAVSPRLLLMDEPLAALDARRRAEILPYLESLRAELEIPVIYVTHAADVVARLADHLVVLEGGRIQAAGPIGEMLTRLDLPLAHESDAAALVEARVAGHDTEFELTVLDFPGGRISIPRRDLPPGRPVRVRILARDVSITLERQTRTSILNVLPATIESMSPEGPSQVLVRLSAGGAPLLARVTRKSATLLGLRPGSAVYAQVKSVALV
jgi:molybdate transport system ATP-binding protein